MIPFPCVHRWHEQNQRISADDPYTVDPEKTDLAKARAVEVWDQLGRWFGNHPQPTIHWNYDQHMRNPQVAYTAYTDRSIYFPVWATNGLGDDYPPMADIYRGLLTHEYCHNRQRGIIFRSLTKWKVEGGAQLFCERVADVLGIGDPLSNYEYDEYVEDLYHHKDDAVKWAMNGQLR